MKRLILAGVGAIAMIATVAGAQAADLARHRAMPTKAPMYEAPYNWTGVYVGINGGGGWGNSNFSGVLAPSSFGTSGGLVGGTLGYNYQAGAAVFGLETDLDWSNIKGSGACAGLTCSNNNTWLGTARGRIGYAFANFLPYVTGGLAYGDVKNSVSGFGSNTTTKAGYAIGGGLEAALSGPWSAKIEYLYADLGRASAPLGTNARFDASTVRAGLNYRF
jgi:outer membrane immunogenic protein